MPYLVKVGYEPKNLNKTTSKGYHIFRKNNKVTIRYGAIEVHGLISKRFIWYPTRLPIEEIYSFSTIDKAKKFMLERIKIRLRHGYNKLSPGKIL